MAAALVQVLNTSAYLLLTVRNILSIVVIGKSSVHTSTCTSEHVTNV